MDRKRPNQRRIKSVPPGSKLSETWEDRGPSTHPILTTNKPDCPAQPHSNRPVAPSPNSSIEITPTFGDSVTTVRLYEITPASQVPTPVSPRTGRPSERNEDT